MNNDTYSFLKPVVIRRLLTVLLLFMVGMLFMPTFSAAQTADKDCLECHGDKEIEGETERGKTLKLFVAPDALLGSVHEGVSCTECHVGAASYEDIPHFKSPPKRKGCADCHEEVALETAKDVHGNACKSGDPLAPSCCACHGGHDIKPLSSPESRFSPNNQPDTCGKCHGGDKLNLTEKSITKRNLVARYKSSIHWSEIQTGKRAATCTDCHGHHKILSSDKKESMVSREGLANACMKCHTLEAKTFWTGAHGSALLHGNHDVPTCTTCHGDHDMTSLRKRVGDAKLWAATQVCIWCHGNARMMRRYGLDTTPVDSYMKDFHGLTQRGTLGASATCADCHDPHHSLPANHPSSRMHISNRGPTCGKCHGEVSDSFAQSFTHKKAIERFGGRIEEIIRIIYIIIILVSISGMMLYCFMIWLEAVRKKMKAQRLKPYAKRLTRFEKNVHMLMFITFTTLAITGFALVFPDTFWARWLFAIGMTEMIRAFIHRVAAILMTLDVVIFGIYMLLRKRGKLVMRELMPAKRDFTDFFKTMKYYLGLTKEEHPPRYAYFNFAEKFEFWALVWGTIVMVVTGWILWFPKLIPASWPSWIIPVATVIHYYEAVLAAAAIVVWHGFHTILHPDEYPMNTSWLTGNLTEKESKHHFDDDAIEKMKE